MDRPWSTRASGNLSVRRTPWQIQRAVVFALIMREMKTRFGAKKFGFFWGFLQPNLFLIIFWVMISLAIRGARSGTGLDFRMFLLTGFLPYGLFRTIVNNFMNAFTANKGLFNYRQVKPIDTLVSRCIVECVVHLFGFALMGFFAVVLEFGSPVHDILLLMWTLFLLVWFSFGLGLVFSVIGTFSETFPNVANVVLTPLFWISGVIIPITSLPEKYQGLLFFNPVLHFIELVRVSYFEGYASPLASYVYIICWTVGCTFLGLWLYTRLENRIILSL